MSEPLTDKELKGIRGLLDILEDGGSEADLALAKNRRRYLATIDERDKQIEALEWLAKVLQGEMKLSGKHDPGCGGRDGRLCDCPYGRILVLTVADYPGGKTDAND